MKKTLKDIVQSMYSEANEANLPMGQWVRSYLKQKRGVIIEFLRNNDLSGTPNNTENAKIAGQILASKITDYNTLVNTPVSDVTISMVGDSQSALKLLKTSPSAFFSCFYLAGETDKFDPDFLDPISIVSGISGVVQGLFGKKAEPVAPAPAPPPAKDNTTTYLMLGGGFLVVIILMVVLMRR